MKKLTAIIIGGGNRGRRYSDIMADMNEQFKVVAVCEPIAEQREYIKQKHSLCDEMCFESYEPLFVKERIADIAVIATQDKDHFIPAMAAIEKGYHLLLEKPISPSPKECLEITKKAKEKNVKVVVCHVLRYAPAFVLTKKLLDEGKIGDIISINHEECVGNEHQSHSFVRGNWANSDRSTFMLLAKSCHDIDILAWLTGKKCLKVQSFGSLGFFKSENAPKGAPDFCIKGCPHGENCPYNAVKLYLDDKENDWFRRVCTGLPSPTDEDVKSAISKSNYGRCVFKCDNDVVDHQTVNMLYEGGITAAFTMCAFNRGGRFCHIMGTKGELFLNNDKDITVYDFKSKQFTKYDVVIPKATSVDGHGGGDSGIIRSLYDYIANGKMSEQISEIDISCQNHLTVFAAESSRITGKTVAVNDFISLL